MNELSAPCQDDNCSDYFEVQEIEQYVGLDWQDIEVDSDSERDFEVPQTLLKCKECGLHFSSKEKLIAHQLGEHSFQEIFKCHVHGCDHKYKKGSMLKSHMKKKHPEFWMAN